MKLRPTEGLPEGELSSEAAELTRLARRSLGHLLPTQHARGLAALRQRLRRRRRPSTVGRFVIAGLGMAGLAVLGQRIFHGEPIAPPAALAVRIEAGTLDSNGAIRAGRDGAPALAFADGTVIELGPGTAGRLESVDARGAHVSIREGSAHVSVVPKPQARWLVDVGPFQIAVHGTAFTAAWNESTGHLDVRLEHGLVSVSGPVGERPISVRTGQHLTIAVKEARVVLKDERAEEPTAVPTAPPVEVKAAHVEAKAARVEAKSVPPRTGETHAARPARAAAASWTVALSAGDFSAIVNDAERDIDRALAERSSEELAALSAAARYLRKNDLARRVLETERRRFPSSPRAADAAIFLGRLDENASDPARALSWYDRCLAEAPAGPYAAEALGRKMMVVRDLAGPSDARQVAGEYVRRFPHGSYAGAAQALRRK